MFARPRPVLTSTAVAGLLTSVAGVLAFLGYDQASAHLSAATAALTSVVIAVVTLASHLLAGLHAQARVTPRASPRDGDGRPLVPAPMEGPLS